MLAEVAITSSVIAVTLVTLFIALSKVKSLYERQERYNDLDAEQIAIEYNKLDNLTDFNYLESKFQEVSEYEVKVYDLNSVGELDTTGDPNYIDYLKNNIDSSETYSKIIVAEVLIQDGEYYYYALKVKE